MKEAYRLTRKDGAPGIDGVRAADYEATLELSGLLGRIKSGRYHVPPVPLFRKRMARNGLWVSRHSKTKWHSVP